MSAFQSLAPRPPANLETVHNILGALVARYRQEQVLTAVRQIPARDAKFRPVPAWVTNGGPVHKHISEDTSPWTGGNGMVLMENFCAAKIPGRGGGQPLHAGAV